MKCKVDIDLGGRSVTIEATPETIEECGEVVDAVKHGLRVLFPNVMFSGDEDFEDSKRRELGKRGPNPGAGKLTRVKPGSFVERVRDAAMRLGTRDFNVIADELDAQSGVVSMMLSKLIKSGFLTEAA